MDLGIVEIIAILGLLSSAIAAYYKLWTKVKSICTSLEYAKKDRDGLVARVEEVEESLNRKVELSEKAIEKRLEASEKRISEQDVFSGRMEERWGFLQEQLSRILNILEKKEDKR